MSPTIGLVIPCYKPHIGLLSRVLWSINNQTRTPDMVIISCSSSEESDIPYKESDYNFPIKFFTHIEKRNVAQNRNFGSRQLNTDIITYFDADDIMHPQRIEIIYQCFLKYPNTRLFLHSLRIHPDNMNFPKYDINAINFECDPCYVCRWGAVNHKHDTQARIMNSNNAIPKKMFDELQFIETPEGYGKEDTLYNACIINKYGNDAVYCNCELTWYFPSNTHGHDNS